MGLVTGLLTLPLAPVRGVAWLAEQVRQEADREYYDPAALRRELDVVDDAYAAGELSEQQRDELQEQLLARLLDGQRRAGPKG
jgi:hypothetical protein